MTYTSLVLNSRKRTGNIIYIYINHLRRNKVNKIVGRRMDPTC